VLFESVGLGPEDVAWVEEIDDCVLLGGVEMADPNPDRPPSSPGFQLGDPGPFLVDRDPGCSAPSLAAVHCNNLNPPASAMSPGTADLRPSHDRLDAKCRAALEDLEHVHDAVCVPDADAEGKGRGPQEVGELDGEELCFNELGPGAWWQEENGDGLLL